MRAPVHVRLAIALAVTSACASVSTVRVQPENVAAGPGLRPIAAIQVNVTSAYFLFIPIPGGVDLDAQDGGAQIPAIAGMHTANGAIAIKPGAIGAHIGIADLSTGVKARPVRRVVDRRRGRRHHGLRRGRDRAAGKGGKAQRQRQGRGCEDGCETLHVSLLFPRSLPGRAGQPASVRQRHKSKVGIAYAFPQPVSPMREGLGIGIGRKMRNPFAQKAESLSLIHISEPTRPY